MLHVRRPQVAGQSNIVFSLPDAVRSGAQPWARMARQAIAAADSPPAGSSPVHLFQVSPRPDLSPREGGTAMQQTRRGNAVLRAVLQCRCVRSAPGLCQGASPTVMPQIACLA